MTRARAEIVLASSNAGKLCELGRLLAGLPVRIRSLRDFPALRLPEEGVDYAANATAKALCVSAATGLPALADDSGLEVDALGGRPGPLSARYGGPGLDDAGRVDRLLTELAEAAGPDAAGRQARFVCVAALALADRRVVTRRGECPGRIRLRPSGEGGFGYDPVFEPRAGDTWRGCTMAELSGAEKNRISHRARAVAALVPGIRAGLLGG